MNKPSPPDIILVRVDDKAMSVFKKIGASQPPMNLIYLATWLREHNHHPEIIDLEVELFSNLEERLKAIQPYLVGITAMTPNIPEAKRVCELCHSLGIKTVLGGAHPTVLPAQTLYDTGCDYVVIGEGEKPLCNLLKSVKDGLFIDNIKGIAFLKKGDEAVVNERPSLLDLDELPVPDRRFLKLELYSGETTPGVTNKSAVVFTSRGCPYACTFCASKLINQQRVRFRSMKKIFEEIDDIASLGFEHLTIEDDTFTLRSDRVKEFCSYLISKYPHLSWDCDSRVDTVSEELLTIMRKSNCKKIAFGVESGSPRILKSINKNITLNQIKRAFTLTRKHKIPSQAFFMIGFPEETLADIKATQELIAEIKPDYLFLSVVTPYPGTPIYDCMVDKGLLSCNNWSTFIFFGEKLSWRTEHFSGEELIAIRKKISRKFYFRPSYIFRKILTIRNVKEIAYLVKGGLVALVAFLPIKKSLKPT